MDKVCKETAPNSGIFTREWSKATVTYDCGTGKEEIVWKSRRATTAKTDDALPNFVLMLSDDTGWGDVGYHGGKAHTPHLDEMSNAPGVLRLERFYAGAPGTDDRFRHCCFVSEELC